VGGVTVMLTSSAFKDSLGVHYTPPPLIPMIY